MNTNSAGSDASVINDHQLSLLFSDQIKCEVPKSHQTGLTRGIDSGQKRDKCLFPGHRGVFGILNMTEP